MKVEQALEMVLEELDIDLFARRAAAGTVRAFGGGSLDDAGDELVVMLEFAAMEAVTQMLWALTLAVDTGLNIETPPT